MAKKKSESTRRLTPPAVLKDLLKLSVACQNRAQRASGEIGQAIKDAKEHKFLNPKAFRLALALAKVGEKDAVELAFLLEDFDHYREVLKIDDMAAEKLPGLDTSPKAKGNGHANGNGAIKESAARSDAALKDSIKSSGVTDLAAARAKKKTGEPSSKAKH